MVDLYEELLCLSQDAHRVLGAQNSNKISTPCSGFLVLRFPGTRGPGHEDSRSPWGKDLRRRWPECTPGIVFKNCIATTVLYWNFSSLPQPRPHPQLHQLHQHPHLGRLSFPLYFSEINPRENLAENKRLPALTIV